jgi:LuxR family maltose regulon positive regulatory protein
MGRLDKFDALRTTADWQTARQDDLFGIVRGAALLSADHLGEAVACAAELSDPVGDLDCFTSFEMAVASNLKAFCAIMSSQFDEVDAAIASADHYHRLSRADFSAGYTASLRGLIQLLKGDADGAASTLEEGLAMQRRDLYSAYATPPLAACYIWALYETDQIDAALAAVMAYSETVHRCSMPDFFAVGIMAMAKTHIAAGQIDQANALLLRAEMHAKRCNWPRFIKYFSQIRSDFRAVSPSRQVGDARHLPAHLTPVCDIAHGTHIHHIHSVILKRDLTIAAELIQQARDLRPGDLWTETQLAFTKAQLLEARGLDQPALRELARALNLSQQCGYRRLAITQAERQRRLMERLLDLTPASSPSHGYVSNIVERIWGTQMLPAGPCPPSSLQLGALTSREIEVARYLRQRMSTREIAKVSHVSENTVKFHLKNIYQKLGVGNRFEACERLQTVDLSILH